MTVHHDRPSSNAVAPRLNTVHDKPLKETIPILLSRQALPCCEKAETAHAACKPPERPLQPVEVPEASTKTTRHRCMSIPSSRSPRAALSTGTSYPAIALPRVLTCARKNGLDAPRSFLLEGATEGLGVLVWRNGQGRWSSKKRIREKTRRVTAEREPKGERQPAREKKELKKKETRNDIGTSSLFRRGHSFFSQYY